MNELQMEVFTEVQLTYHSFNYFFNRYLFWGGCVHVHMFGGHRGSQGVGHHLSHGWKICLFVVH